MQYAERRLQTVDRKANSISMRAVFVYGGAHSLPISMQQLFSVLRGLAAGSGEDRLRWCEFACVYVESWHTHTLATTPKMLI